MITLNKTVADVDRELAAAVHRRNAARVQIKKLSQAIINDTREIDRLLAERAFLTMSQVPDTPEGIELPPRPAVS